MGSRQSLSLLVVLAAVLLTGTGQDDPYYYEDEGFAFGEQNGTIVTVPTCATDEYLTSNGTRLLCRKLPDVGFCDCPDLVPIPGNENETTTPVAPLPPPGCEVFNPPTRGAFACLRAPNNIYCSVLCDHRFEFSVTPRNPYYCGRDTQFNWRDFPNGIIQDSLPACTGFRHRHRLLHRYENYLPSPCYGLSDYTIRIILEELFEAIKEGSVCTDCVIEDSFVQCPEVKPSARNYTQVANARTDYKKK